MAEEKAREAVATFGLPREIGPQEALLEDLHWTAGHVSWLRHLIGDLEHEASGRARVGGDDEDDGEMPERSSSGTSGLKQYHRDKGLLWEKPSVWLEIYQTERKHLVDVSKACVAANVSEAQVRLAEQQGEMLATVIDRVLTDLGVRDHPEANSTVRRHLELVAGGVA